MFIVILLIIKKVGGIMKFKKFYISFILLIILSIISCFLLYNYGKTKIDKKYNTRITEQYNSNLLSAINVLNQIKDDTDVNNNKVINDCRVFIEKSAVLVLVLSPHFEEPNTHVSLNNVSSHIQSYSNKLQELINESSGFTNDQKISRITNIKDDLQKIYDSDLFKDTNDSKDYKPFIHRWESIVDNLVYKPI